MPETPVFSTAAVAAPHDLAARSGRDVLAQGGNAVEAMIAMAATIAVVYPHMNGMGGDGFWLVAEPNGRVRGFEACGPAGEHATIARYRAKDWDGALAALRTCREVAEGLSLTALYDLYAERIASFRAEPPPVDWAGVYVATSK